jgi:UDP-3-O-[3-hydroxymyristoyl] glucosamine N-acyltransferase
MALSIAELAAKLGLEFQGDGAAMLERVSSWEAADRSALVFREESARPFAPPDPLNAGCVLAPAHLVLPAWPAILSMQPKLDFARAAVLLVPSPVGSGRRDATAVVASDAVIGRDVDLGPWVTVGAGARIGDGSILDAGVVVGAGAVVGEHCRLHPRVVLYPGVRVGARVVLHAGVVIGSDGFGYVFDGASHLKFPQAGSAVIEDDVEIGANTTVDRGSLGTTRIGSGAKIDNLVQIAHNVQIGRNVVIAAQTGVSGSTTIDDGAIIGGQVGFGDHARVESGAVIGSKAGVLPGKIVRGGEVYWGVPVRPLREYKRLNALFGRLPEFKERIEALERALADRGRGGAPREGADSAGAPAGPSSDAQEPVERDPGPEPER